MHKPARVLCDPNGIDGRKHIYDLPGLSAMKVPLLPVGRMDYESEGVLLLTNDGDLNFKLSTPKASFPRRYRVQTIRELTGDQIKAIKAGVSLRDGVLKDVEIKHLDEAKTQGAGAGWYDITVRDGRHRAVARLFEHMGVAYKKLIRTGYAGIRLPGDLPPGQYRQLSAKEIQTLRDAGDGLEVGLDIYRPTKQLTKEALDEEASEKPSKEPLKKVLKGKTP